MQADDPALVLQAAAYLQFAYLLVRRIGMHSLRFESLQSWTRKKRTSVPISKLFWAAMMGTRIMPNSTCLVTASVATRLLGQHGYKST